MNKLTFSKAFKILIVGMALFGIVGAKGCELNPFDEPAIVPTPKSD